MQILKWYTKLLCMGLYALREISRRNYDSARRKKHLGRCNNLWEIFLIASTCPHMYIMELFTRGNRRMNAHRDADGLFPSALLLTRSDCDLSRSVFITYKMGKPWDKRQRTAHLNRLVSKSLKQCPVQEPRCYFYRLCHHFYWLWM